MSRLVLAAALFAAHLGCATPAPRSVVARPSGGGSGVPERKYVCEMERETGSNFMHRICRPIDDGERERERVNTQLMLEQMQRAQPPESQLTGTGPGR